MDCGYLPLYCADHGHVSSKVTTPFVTPQLTELFARYRKYLWPSGVGRIITTPPLMLLWFCDVGVRGYCLILFSCWFSPQYSPFGCSNL